MDISLLDVEIDVDRSPTNDRAVRVTHLPSGICVASEDLPTREQNYEAAMHMLQEALGG